MAMLTAMGEQVRKVTVDGGDFLAMMLPLPWRIYPADVIDKIQVFW